MKKTIDQSLRALSLHSEGTPRRTQRRLKDASADPATEASSARAGRVAPLLNLASELQLKILENLPASSVHNVQLVNHQLNALATPRLYRKLYGASILHRAPTSDPLDAKHLALEEERIQQNLPRAWRDPKDLLDAEQLNAWLEDIYEEVSDCFLKNLTRKASQALIRLQNAVGADKELWHEAVATWLMVQGRQNEAVTHYQKASTLAQNRGEPTLDERVRIVDARFGIPPAEGIRLPPWDALTLPTRDSAFVAACLGGRVDAAQTLLLHPISDEAKQIGLNYAFMGHHRVLLQALEPVAAALSMRERFMMAAALEGSLDIVQDFHEAGASLESQVNGRSIATCAARANHVHILQYLHEQGVDLAAPYDASVGLTPLGTAVEEGAADAVGYLVSLGALADGEEESYDTPLQRAMTLGDVAVVEAMVNNGLDLRALVASPTGGWLDALLGGKYGGEEGKRILQVVDFVFGQGHADINAVDASGKRAWQYAAHSTCIPVITRLIELGANTWR
jgi:hypothetical protein